MNQYTKMQYEHYESTAKTWNVESRDPVVGGFDLHNNWKDYDDYLFTDIKDTKSKICLDFGCGPGRNLVKYSDKFKELHGTDISQTNLNNARLWIEHNKIDINKHKLIITNGTDLNEIQSDYYDVIMSTICFQHICVYDIRYGLLNEFHRVLKKGGMLTMQMGFGPIVSTKNSVDYYENKIDAGGTNGMMDTRVEDPMQIQGDLDKIGFHKFKNYIRPVGPGDGHPNWIFFNAVKR